MDILFVFCFSPIFFQFKLGFWSVEKLKLGRMTDGLCFASSGRPVVRRPSVRRRRSIAFAYLTYLRLHYVVRTYLSHLPKLHPVELVQKDAATDLNCQRYYFLGRVFSLKGQVEVELANI